MTEEWARLMYAAKNGAERREVAEKLGRYLGVSIDKAYKLIHEAGWDSGRKKRKDAGTSSLSEEKLELIAGLQKASQRKNGKTTMYIPTARSVAGAQGIEINVSNSTIRAQLRKRKLSAKDSKIATPYQRMKSEYPNQVHMTDPSNCLLYFSPGGRLKIIDDHEHYKNKDFYEEGKKLKCLRYVLTDHFSASICVRYYEALGETALNMYDFLLYAWGKKKDPLYVFHGLPEMLIWDCGSGNNARATKNALASLKVTTQTHIPGNPRAKGQVEGAQNIVETQFESRLRFEPVHSLEELNDAAERWCSAFNANKIKGQDTRLNRNGVVISRTLLWQRINAEQLKELPDPEICEQVFAPEVETRKVAGDLAITFVHPNIKRSMRYSLSHLPGILVGQSVNVQPLLVNSKDLIIVSYELNGEKVSRECQPIDYDAHGFDIDAPVFGKEYKRLPDTLREKNAKELTELAAGKIPFENFNNGQGIKAHSYINATDPFIKPRTGDQITVSKPDRIEIHDILITHFEAARQVKARNGWVDESFIGRMKKEFPGGVPSSLVGDIARDEAAGSAAIAVGENNAEPQHPENVRDFPRPVYG